METKYSGVITEHKQIERDGVPIGIVKGYIATWDVDQGKDQFMPGAFAEHLKYYRDNGLNIPMKAMHDVIIGGYPIETVKEDDKGLYGEGEINLNIEAGRNAYGLVKQKVLARKSIGYEAIDKEWKDGIRIIRKSKVYEGSIVDHPMNLNAVVTDVKGDNGTMSITDIKNIRKSELVKLFRPILSKDAADYVAALIMTNALADKTDESVKMLNEIADQIQAIQETLKK